MKHKMGTFLYPEILLIGMSGSGSMSPEHKWTLVYIKEMILKVSREKKDHW